MFFDVSLDDLAAPLPKERALQFVFAPVQRCEVAIPSKLGVIGQLRRSWSPFVEQVGQREVVALGVVVKSFGEERFQFGYFLAALPQQTALLPLPSHAHQTHSFDFVDSAETYSGHLSGLRGD